jgi:uncharacterized membrane protein YphA (DoxX/SURF4 family)
MEDSIAHPRASAAVLALPGWKTAASHLAAFLTAVLFIVAGVWKITDPFNAAALVAQARVPASLSLIGACVLGVSETVAGVLVLTPRFRRWGAWLAGALLAFFMIYIAANYSALAGQECNCFPWIKRTVGPGFFIGDAVMLGLAAVAGWWARPSSNLRAALVVLLAVAVFAAVSYGVNERMQAAVVAPSAIQVDGKPFPLRQGRVLLYFFDPECMHCNAAARQMATYRWAGNVRIVGVPTEQPQFASYFMQDTGLRAPVSFDTKALRKVFSFTSAPYAVALDNGRLKEAFTEFDEKEPSAGLRRLGFIQ